MNAPTITRKVLPNGLTLLVQEDHSHPLVAFHAVVPTGSATEGEFLGAGISHVVEHMLFKGTQRRAVGAVEKEARSYGGNSQGFTTYDTTSYQLTVNREHWSQAADLMVDALFHSTLDAGEFLKERDVVLRELKLRRDDPSQVVWDLLFSNVYHVHPYRIPIIGYEPLLMKLTAEDIRNYYRRWYLPNTLTIAVVGDVQTEEVIRRMQELTAGLAPGRVPQEPVTPEPSQLSARRLAEEGEAQLGMAAIGFPSVSVSDPDLTALDLLSWLLGSGRGSRLEKTLRDTGVVHSVSAWNYTPKDRGLFAVSMRMDPEKAEESTRRAMEELDRVTRVPFPAGEMEAAKRALLREDWTGRQTVAGQAGDLAGFEVAVGDPLFPYEYLRQVQRLTPEDLRLAAARYLRPERATVVILLPRKGESQAPRAAVSKPAVSVTEKVVLKNQLRILLSENHRVPLVTLQVSMLGGVRYETESTNGLSGLTARMMTRGSRRHSADGITEVVKEMGGELGSTSGRNSLGLTLTVAGAVLEPAVNLLEELLMEPVFPEEELEKERRLALAGLKAQEEEPFSWGIRRLTDTLFTRHPYRLDPAGNPKSLSSVNREDLVKFHERVLQPDRMVISAAGDFKRETLLALLDRFENLKPPAAPAVSVPAEPPLSGARERMEATPRQEGLILIGFPALKISDPRVPLLDLIEAILSGGAGRLFSEVRERQGLAYTVGGFAMHGVDPGAFVLYGVTDPVKLQSVREALLEEVEKIRTALIPQEELQEAKQGLLGNRRIALQTQQALASQLASDELYGLGYDYERKYEEQVKSATASDLQALAKELLDPKRCVVLMGRPKEGAVLAAPVDSRKEPEPDAAPAGPVLH